jgi:chromosome segregation ATPase
MQIQADLEVQQDEIQRIGAAGFQVMSNFDSTVVRLEKQMRQLSESVASVRKDGEGQQADIKSLKTQISDAKWNGQSDAVVARLDQQLQTTDRVVTELRQMIQKSKSETTSLRSELTAAQKEIAEVKRANVRLKHDADEAKQVAQEGIATSKLYASEVASLRREITQLRSELAQENDHHQPSVDEDPSISSHQLDILASNISKIGNRASQVESLQMEFDLFRTRVQRLEARIVSGTPNTSRKDVRSSLGEYGSVPEQGSQSHYGATTRQKRPTISREESHMANSTPSKRVAISSDYPSLATLGYASTGEQQQSSPGGMALVATPVQRRTTAASANKSTVRRGRWGAKT